MTTHEPNPEAALGRPIASIKATSRDPAWCTVRVGRAAVARLFRSSLEELGLRAGMIWNESLAAAVEPVAARDAARRDALRTLHRRAIGSRELIERLHRKGHSAAAAEAAVGKLASAGWLDDAAYARMLIDSERRRKPAGQRLLHQKLRQKRLAPETIAQVLEESEADHDPIAEARSLALRKLALTSMQRCEPLKRKRRLWGILARRGFDPETITAALDGIEGLDDDGSDPG